MALGHLQVGPGRRHDGRPVRGREGEAAAPSRRPPGASAHPRCGRPGRGFLPAALPDAPGPCDPRQVRRRASWRLALGRGRRAPAGPDPSPAPAPGTSHPPPRPDRRVSPAPAARPLGAVGRRPPGPLLGRRQDPFPAAAPVLSGQRGPRPHPPRASPLLPQVLPSQVWRVGEGRSGCGRLGRTWVGALDCANERFCRKKPPGSERRELIFLPGPCPWPCGLKLWGRTLGWDQSRAQGPGKKRGLCSVYLYRAWHVVGVDQYLMKE